jgi:oligosaccharide repeat unit polymerase
MSHLVNIEKREIYYFLFLISFFALFVIIFVIYSYLFLVPWYDPLFIVTISYIFLFFIAPINDLLYNNITYYGHIITDGLFKGTLIFLLGYISLLFGYTQNINSRIFTKSTNSSKTEMVDSLLIKHKIKLNLFLWFFLVILTLFELHTAGGIFFRLSFGIFKTTSNFKLEIPLNFLLMFSFTIVVPETFLVILLRSKTAKFFIWITTLWLLASLGFRFILFIGGLSPFIFKFLKVPKLRKKTFLILLVIFIIILVVSSLVGEIRKGLWKQTEVSLNTTLDSMFLSFLQSNFEIYKSYYVLVKEIPKNHDFTYGKQISYTFKYIIPRFLWNSKPEPEGKILLRNVFGEIAYLSGIAWPNIGEYYSEFGIFGVVILMFILGIFLKFIKNLITHKENINSLVLYSILYSSLIQIIFRGYTPSNFWMIFFFFLIVLINNSFDKFFITVKQTPIKIKKITTEAKL